MARKAADLRARSLYLRPELGTQQEDREQDHRHPRRPRLAVPGRRAGQGERHDAPRRLAAGIRGWSVNGYQRFLPRDGTRTTAHGAAEVAEAAEAEALLKPAEVCLRD